MNTNETKQTDRRFASVQSAKQRQSSMIAEQRYSITAPNFYSELASAYKQKKKRF